MTTTDDRIRDALHADVPAPAPVDPAELAAALATRVARRRHRRTRIRLAGVAGAVIVVLALAATAVTRDGDPVLLAEGGASSTTAAPTTARPSGALQLGGLSAYAMAPDLEAQLRDRRALVLIGTVRAVGEERPVTITVPSDPAAPIPPITYDWTPIDLDVDEVLQVGDGGVAPDPIRLRIIGGMAEGTPLGTTQLRSVADQVPIGSRLLVFATAPVDVGDGLAATPSYLYWVTPDGVVDEGGELVALDDVRSRFGPPDRDDVTRGTEPVQATEDLLEGAGGLLRFVARPPADGGGSGIGREAAEGAALAAATASGVPADAVLSAGLGTALISLADGSTREVGAWLVRLRVPATTAGTCSSEVTCASIDAADAQEVTVLIQAESGEPIALFAVPPA
jgi:hypothetical protein